MAAIRPLFGVCVFMYKDGGKIRPGFKNSYALMLTAFPLRLLTGPYFRMVDLLKKSAAITVFCRPDPERFDGQNRLNVFLRPRRVRGPNPVGLIEAGGTSDHYHSFERIRLAYSSGGRKEAEGLQEGFSRSGYPKRPGCTDTWGIQPPISPRETSLCLDLLAAEKPDLIGMSVRTICLDEANDLTRAIRNHLSIPVLYGGIGPTVDPQEAITQADSVCLGEGEAALLEFVNHWEGKREVGRLANWWVRQRQGVIRNPLRPLLEDLDQLPFPDYDAQGRYLIEDNRLISPAAVLSNYAPPIYEIMTTRGCPFSCTYCCNDYLTQLYPRQKRVRRRSPDHVIAELRLAKTKYEIGYIYFQDDVFTINREWIERFAHLYQEQIGLPFWCYTHPKLADPHILSTLKQSGLDRLTMGVQSGSDRILRDIFKRETSRTEILKAANLMKELHINYDLDFITNNPFEAEADCAQTLDLLLQLPKPVRLNYGLAKLSFFPSYQITTLLDKQGGDPSVDEVRYAFWNRLYLLTQSSWLPRKVIRGLSHSRFLYGRPSWLSYLRPVATIRGVLKIKVQQLPRGMTHFLKKINRWLTRIGNPFQNRRRSES